MAGIQDCELWPEVELFVCKLPSEFVELEELPNGTMSACEQTDYKCVMELFIVL